MRHILLALALVFCIANSPADTKRETTDDAIQALVDNGEDARAFKLAREAAATGDVRAHEWLGWFYDNGRGVTADTTRALEHYEIAIAGGQNYARWRVGVLIDTGEAPGTLERAVELFTLAAEDGYTNAMTSLAVMNATGRGTPLDYEASLANYMRAAEAGNPHGVQGVGVLFALGQGVPQDNEEAAAWFLVAAEAGNEAGAANFERTANGMPAYRLAFVFKRAQVIANELGLDLSIDVPLADPAK